MIIHYDNFHGGGDFLHVYVIVYKYFGKKTKNAENDYINFYKKLDMFSWCVANTWGHTI